jgi:argininosuccinate lyase
MRLWLRDEIDDLTAIIKGFVSACVMRATAEIDVLMPGYTHLQVPPTAVPCRSNLS